MSLITCPECKKEISSSAEKCPNCGYPIQKEIEQNKIKQSKKDYKKGVLFTLVALFIVLVLVAVCSRNDKDVNKSPTTKDLNLNINFTGTQFVITNNDNFTYNDCKIEINDKYYLEGLTIKAGETYTVGMMQFADKNGERFGFMQKPQTVYVRCTKGSFLGKWK